MKFKKILKGWFYSLGSIKLGVVLLALIILSSVIGTLIPQDLAPFQYVQKYGHKTYLTFRNLGLTSIYYSPFFISLLTLLGINLIICTLNRINLKKITLIIMHLSLVVILTGSLLSLISGEKGTIGLHEGELTSRFISQGKQKELGFTVKLERFTVEYYDIETHSIVVYVDGNQKMQLCDMKIGEYCPVKNSSYNLQLIDFYPDFYLQKGKPASKTNNPDNPAVLVKITKDKSEETRWLLSKFPNFAEAAEFKDILTVYDFQAPVKEYKSEIAILEKGKEIKKADLKVNRPLTHKGYSLYQSDYNPDDLTWSGLKVKKDPAITIVYFGFIVLNLSVILNFYRKAQLKFKGEKSEP